MGDKSGTKKQRIGVISDTHGLLRPEAIDVLSGVDHILHAGDIGRREVLDRLEHVAPTTAIRGNVDDIEVFPDLADTEVVEIAGHSFYLVHNLERLDLDPVASGFRVVVSGHTHRPKVENRGGVLYLNPGAAGHRRFRLQPSVAVIEVVNGSLETRIVELGDEFGRNLDT